MTKNEFLSLLSTTEPVLTFRGTDYQICCIDGRYLFGAADSEEQDQWFDSAENLLLHAVLGGYRLCEILSEIQ